ncbi:hypothetical protein RND71_030791 [Anisodus tanguticus]|uniref:Uncharacterized protein n=1 Tax=Anisodus tanguticus TaxID=243964 RepID=A0AAE1RH24_9SOLA|nr:hypothetical protein RND71_030791 [Anisodus tanguticus]
MEHPHIETPKPTNVERRIERTALFCCLCERAEKEGFVVSNGDTSCMCTDLLARTPSPVHEFGADVASPPPESPTPTPLSNLTFPPAPPQSNLSPDSSLTPSPVNTATSSPAPASNYEFASDISHELSKSGGKKAGIAVGVIAAICFVGLGALVYKKRQQNIQRTQFGHSVKLLYNTIELSFESIFDNTQVYHLTRVGEETCKLRFSSSMENERPIGEEKIWKS